MSLWTNREWHPMLLKEVDEPFDSKEYIYEMKYDGIRALCFVNKKEITFLSRNGVDLTYLYPELENIKNNVTKNVIFDGEIIAFDDQEKPSFTKLQERSHSKDKNKIKINSKMNPVVFIVFDILYENKDLINIPLSKRKEILNKYKDTEYFVKAKYIEEEGKKFFQEIKKKDLEGIVAKLKNSTYHPSKRTNDFIKIKNIKRDEFLIGAYQINKVNLSLFIGEYEKSQLIYIGKCSLSLTNPISKEILKKKNTNNSFINLKEKNITYIKPTYCYIEYTERTKSNNLRHPVFKGLVS